MKEAVQIARDNNFMGLICSSRLLVRTFPYLTWRHVTLAAPVCIFTQNLTLITYLGSRTGPNRIYQDGWPRPHHRHLRRQRRTAAAWPARHRRALLLPSPQRRRRLPEGQRRAPIQRDD